MTTYISSDTPNESFILFHRRSSDDQLLENFTSSRKEGKDSDEGTTKESVFPGGCAPRFIVPPCHKLSTATETSSCAEVVFGVKKPARGTVANQGRLLGKCPAGRRHAQKQSPAKGFSLFPFGSNRKEEQVQEPVDYGKVDDEIISDDDDDVENYSPSSFLTATSPYEVSSLSSSSSSSCEVIEMKRCSPLASHKTPQMKKRRNEVRDLLEKGDKDEKAKKTALLSKICYAEPVSLSAFRLEDATQRYTPPREELPVSFQQPEEKPSFLISVEKRIVGSFVDSIVRELDTQGEDESTVKWEQGKRDFTLDTTKLMGQKVLDKVRKHPSIRHQPLRLCLFTWQCLDRPGELPIFHRTYESCRADVQSCSHDQSANWRGGISAELTFF